MNSARLRAVLVLLLFIVTGCQTVDSFALRREPSKCRVEVSYFDSRKTVITTTAVIGSVGAGVSSVVTYNLLRETDENMALAAGAGVVALYAGVMGSMALFYSGQTGMDEKLTGERDDLALTRRTYQFVGCSETDTYHPMSPVKAQPQEDDDETEDDGPPRR